MEKKKKLEPECQDKKKAIIDIGRNRMPGVRIACTSPSYSPDLAPSDFHLLRHLQKHLKGTRYSSNAEMQPAVSHFPHFQSRVHKLISRWLLCVELNGDYVEV